jgi:hypothetical protein
MGFVIGDKVGCFLQQSKDRTVFIGFGVVVDVSVTPPVDVYDPVDFDVDLIHLDDRVDGGWQDPIWTSECAVYDEKTSLKILSESDLIEHIDYEEVLRLRRRYQELTQGEMS